MPVQSDGHDRFKFAPERATVVNDSGVAVTADTVTEPYVARLLTKEVTPGAETVMVAPPLTANGVTPSNCLKTVNLSPALKAGP